LPQVIYKCTIKSLHCGFECCVWESNE